MSSAAYAAWTGARAHRLDQLITAHIAVGGSGPGRRWETEQLNWALTLMLAGEFQGFCRDLHDEAVDFLVNIVSLSPAVESVLRSQLTRDRKLDRGNARPETLREDFLRFGFDLRAAINAAQRVRGPRCWAGLSKLNSARNAIAHANHAALVSLQQEGYPINKRTILRWRGQLDALAQKMDDVVAAALDVLLGAGRPW